MTRYGRRILDIVNHSRCHPTAEQIYGELRLQEPQVVLATVYNNLAALCREGKIRKLSLEGSVDRYDRIEPHDHMICRRCGRLTDISIPDLTSQIEKVLGFPVDSYDLRVRCLCEDCRREMAKAESEGN